MKTEASSKSWDDLVFENRNKEYGAYLVRKSYTQHMTTGLGLSVAVACLLLILPRILNLIGNGNSIIPPIELPADAGTIFTQPPTVPLPKPPPPDQARSVTPPVNLPPEVVTTETTDVIPTVDELSEAMPSTDDGKGAVPTEASTGIIDAPPAPIENKIFIHAEVMPEYDGGLKKMMQYISGRIRYPASAQRQGIEGTVYISFVIDEEGKVTDVSVTKGISADIDKEAVRVIASMKKWTPGMQNKRAVSVRMTLPIKFQLEH